MPPPPLVILAHAPNAQALANEAAAHLRALGYAVAALPNGRHARVAQIAAAHGVVLLWSRQAAKIPALRIAAKTAHAQNKLACMRLDAAVTPFRVRAATMPRGRTAEQAWRRLLAQGQIAGGAEPPSGTTHMTDSTRVASRLAGLGVLVLFTLIVLGALYVTDATPLTPWVDHLIGR